MQPVAKDLHVRELYVDASAPGNGDGSRLASFSSIASARAMAQSGTRVLIAPGTYPTIGSVTGLQDTPAAPIALVGRGDVTGR